MTVDTYKKDVKDIKKREELLSEFQERFQSKGFSKKTIEPVPTTDIMQPPFHVIFEKSGSNFEKIRRTCRTMFSGATCTRIQELKTA